MPVCQTKNRFDNNYGESIYREPIGRGEGGGGGGRAQTNHRGGDLGGMTSTIFISCP